MRHQYAYRVRGTIEPQWLAAKHPPTIQATGRIARIYPRKNTVMMSESNGMMEGMGGMMWGMGLLWLLVIIVLILAAIALGKYIWGGRR